MRHNKNVRSHKYKEYRIILTEEARRTIGLSSNAFNKHASKGTGEVMQPFASRLNNGVSLLNVWIASSIRGGHACTFAAS